jgi:hypothetical protein
MSTVCPSDIVALLRSKMQVTLTVQERQLGIVRGQRATPASASVISSPSSVWWLPLASRQILRFGKGASAH